MANKLISESEGLRLLNLPLTHHWREFVRKHASPLETASGKFYDRTSIEVLALKVSPLAADVFGEVSNKTDDITPPTPRSGPTRIQYGGPSGVRYGKPVEQNRQGINLNYR